MQSKVSKNFSAMISITYLWNLKKHFEEVRVLTNHFPFQAHPQIKWSQRALAGVPRSCLENLFRLWAAAVPVLLRPEVDAFTKRGVCHLNPPLPHPHPGAPLLSTSADPPPTTSTSSSTCSSLTSGPLPIPPATWRVGSKSKQLRPQTGRTRRKAKHSSSAGWNYLKACQNWHRQNSQLHQS